LSRKCEALVSVLLTFFCLCSVEEDEILEYIKHHTRGTVNSLELIDNVALVITHIFQAKLSLAKEQQSRPARKKLLEELKQVLEKVRGVSSGTKSEKGGNGSNRLVGNVYQLSSYAICQIAICLSVLGAADVY